jgi:hypothetical protein
MTWLNNPIINNSVRNTISPSDYSVTKLVWDGPAYGKIANIGKYYINSGSDAVPAIQASLSGGSAIEKCMLVSTGSNDNPANVSQISALRFNKKHVICGDDFVNIFNLDWENNKTNIIPQDHIFVTKDTTVNGVPYTGTFDLDNYVYKFVCNFNMTNLNSNSRDWLIWRQAIGGGLRLYFTKGINTPVAGGVETGNNIKFLTVSQGNAGANQGVYAASYGNATPIGPMDIHASGNNNLNDFSNPIQKPNAAASYLTFPICSSQAITNIAVSSNLPRNANIFSGFTDNTWRNNIINSTVSKINPRIAPFVFSNGYQTNEATALNALESSTTEGKDQIYNINNYNSNFNPDPVNHFSFEFFICKEYFNEYSNDMKSKFSILPFSISLAAAGNASFPFNPYNTAETNGSGRYTYSLFRELGTGKFQFPFMSFVFINTNALPAVPPGTTNVSFFHGNQPFTKHFIGAVNTADNATPNNQAANPPSEFDIFSFPSDMIKNVEMNIIRIKR